MCRYEEARGAGQYHSEATLLSLELIVNGLLKSPTTDQRTIYVFEKAKKKDPQNFSWSP